MCWFLHFSLMKLTLTALQRLIQSGMVVPRALAWLAYELLSRFGVLGPLFPGSLILMTHTLLIAYKQQLERKVSCKAGCRFSEARWGSIALILQPVAFYLQTFSVPDVLKCEPYYGAISPEIVSLVPGQETWWWATWISSSLKYIFKQFLFSIFSPHLLLIIMDSAVSTLCPIGLVCVLC